MPKTAPFLIVFLRHSVTALTAVTLTIMIGKCSNTFARSQVQTIDPAQALITFVQHVGTNDTDADYTNKVRAFHDKLLAVIKSYSRQTGTIVLNSAAVLDGAEDITDYLVALALTENADQLAQSARSSRPGDADD